MAPYFSIAFLKTVRATLFLIALSLLSGCADARAAASYRATCLSLGFCDEPPEPPVLVDLLCDPSIGSSCGIETATATVASTLRLVGRRPRSHVRFWVLGRTVGDTVLSGEQTVPPRSSRGSGRSLRAQEERFTKSATDYLVTSARPTLESQPIRRSPLSEAIAKIGLADSGGLPRLLVVITDAREVSPVADFECGFLPTEKHFLQKLKQRGLLTPGTLTGMQVELAHVQGKPVPARGCPVQVDREVKVRALWTAALKAAGAAEVRVSTGPASLLREENPSPSNAEGDR